MEFVNGGMRNRVISSSQRNLAPDHIFLCRGPDVPNTTMWKVQGACSCVSFAIFKDVSLCSNKHSKSHLIKPVDDIEDKQSHSF